jgi:hypothetical protein
LLCLAVRRHEEWVHPRISELTINCAPAEVQAFGFPYTAQLLTIEFCPVYDGFCANDTSLMGQRAYRGGELVRVFAPSPERLRLARKVTLEDVVCDALSS